VNEVSIRAVEMFLSGAQRHVDRAVLLAGTSVAPDPRDRLARVDWDTFCRILGNGRPILRDDDYVAIGERGLHSPVVRSFVAIARTLLSPAGLYRWNLRSGGLGSQMFRCVHSTFRDVSATRGVLELRMAPGYEPSRELFLLTYGGMREMPRLFGLAQSSVALSIADDVARYEIEMPRATGVRARLVGLLRRKSDAKEVASDLEATLRGLEKMVDDRTRELREARDELAATVAQLREAQEVRQRFFANISHEIRTPLSLIVLAAGDVAARAGAALDDRARENLGSVNEAARKMVRLVDELLLLAAAQEDKLALHREPTDLPELIGRVAIAWRLAAEAAGVELAVATPDALVADVDPVALERVASNLISNAIKYTPSGGRVEIELGFEPAQRGLEPSIASAGGAGEQGGIRLSVRDDGPGIAEELAARLFGRFERARGETRRKQGTGLGLFLVRQLVEAHGGTVAPYARVPRGSEVRVVLPATLAIRDAMVRVGRPRPLQLPPDAAEPTSEPRRFAPTQTSAGTILLVEDDVALAEQVARLLAERYTVIVAHDGARALELARVHIPQLLVTDVDMPGMDGVELARRFRDAVGDRLAPIVMLSAVVDLRSRVAGLEAGAIDYITKPFDPLELSARVDAQFRTRDLAMRLHRAEQLSALGILTSGLAHELRNPANGIVNAIAPLVELLPPEATRPGTATRDLLDVVASCADQVGCLARQLLGVRSSGELELRPALLGDIVERTLVLAQRALHGVELRAEVDARLAVACAAPLLVQVLTNLVDNAAHAAGAGGWVSIASEARGGRVAIEIGDSGPGVPAELRERVFEPFFTTKPEGSGVGLGLAVARAIVQRHRGVLEIRERGGRCVFVVELPDLETAKVANAV
jgi:signal transduction histidine kinase